MLDQIRPHGLAECELVQREVQFYRDYRSQLDIEAPHCFYGAIDPDTFNSILIFEDMAARKVEFCTHTTSITRLRAEGQMELLARVHAHFHDHPAVTSGELMPFDTYFEKINRFFTMETFSDQGFVAAEEVIPARLFRRRAEVWPATLQAMELERSMAMPLTLAHNDVHLRNWYIAGDGAMGLADWQCFVKGLWVRDVAYTMVCALDVADCRAWDRDLLLFYIDRLWAHGGPRLDFDAAWTAFRRQTLSSLMWWTGTLSMAYTQPRDSILEFIRRLATGVDDLDALDSFR